MARGRSFFFGVLVLTSIATGAVAAPKKAPAKPARAAAKTPKPPVPAGTPGKSEQGFATLSRAVVPASGREESILTVDRFGRYSVSAKSTQGTAVQVVSRMIGPGEVFGEAGNENGRVDMFLDRGEYKILALSHPKGTGKAALTPHDFKELNATPPLLVETKDVDGELEDYQQLSWWIDVDARRTVALEAAGRNLTDLRLWKDGTWLVDAAPTAEDVQPVVGQPLHVMRLVTQLEPGLYLLSAYGGKGVAWAEQSKKHPFHLRYGIPKLAVAGRARRDVSAFGFDRFLVPGTATFYRVELPEARTLRAEVHDYSAESPFNGSGSHMEVTKKSVPPVAETTVVKRSADNWREVVVTADAGQPYVLQHFEASRAYAFAGTQDYWVSTVHSGNPVDSIDATAILSSRTAYGEHEIPVATSLISIDSSKAYRRKFNLLEELDLYVDIKSRGRYAIDAKGEGVQGEFRFEPFLTSRPAHYVAPDWQGSGSKWDLDAGIYIFEARPKKQGIIDVSIHEDSIHVFSWGAPTDTSPTVVGSAHFPRVTLVYNTSYELYSNTQPGVQVGAVVRSLPLDLAEALPLTLTPGESLKIPFDESEIGTLRARMEDGTSLDLSVDGKPAAKDIEVIAGHHEVTVALAATEKQTRVFSLGFEPKRLSRTAPLPPLPDAAKAKLPNFPVLTEGKPIFFDLARTAQSTFLVKAEKAELFRLQTTGLLASAGALRTRTVPSFDRREQNGVGRNFLVQQYLREGDYQLTVAALGESAGHLGVELARTRMIDGGELFDGVPARVSVPAGAAVSYTFTVKERGTYRLNAFGLGRTFRARLEDSDGWPLVPPNGDASFEQVFEKGSYRLVVLPEAVPGKQLTRLERVREAAKLKGHGPHTLALGSCANNTWTEPAGDGARDPDVFEIDVPAPIDSRFTLSNEMEGTLYRTDGGAKIETGSITVTNGFNAPIATGHYRLEARCARHNNHVAYRVCAGTNQFVPGLSVEYTAPMTVAVSVGSESLVELSSFGQTDVRATLTDTSGRFVASNDDRPDDWNFLVARKLAPGRYTLAVDPVGASSGRVTISMNVPKEVVEGALTLPVKQEVRSANEQHVYPLSLPGSADFLVVSARAQESIGVAVERENGGGWKPLGTNVGRNAHLEIPLGDSRGALRLRLWSIDRRGNPATLRVAAVKAPVASESSLEGGVALAAPDGVDVAMGVAKIPLSRPSSFRIDGDPARVRYTASADRAADVSPDGSIVGTDGAVWIVADLAELKSKTTVRAPRVTLSNANRDGVTLPVPVDAPLVADVEASNGPVVVIATSRGGQPGVRVEDAPSKTPAPGLVPFAAGTRTAVAVSLSSKKPAAIVWSAVAGDPIETRLVATTFPAATKQSLAAGVTGGTLSGGTARSWDLPRGAKHLRLSLAPGLVAALADGDRVISVQAAIDDASTSTLDTTAEKLVLLDTSTRELPYELEIVPVEKSALPAAVSSASPFERSFPSAGTAELPLAPAAAGATLHVQGGSATVVGIDGSFGSGTDVALPARGGTLSLTHGVGLAVAWIDSPTDKGEGFWGSQKSVRESKVDGPSSVALEGAVQALRIETKTPAMVHLRSTTPALARVTRNGEPPSFSLFPKGITLDTYSPGASVDVTLRAVAAGSLAGRVDITTTPVTSIDEGLGPEALLGAGDTRVYSFRVAKGGQVGVGVRADSDSIDAKLLDSKGTAIGTGIVQMPELAAGTYLLAVHVSESGSPTRVRPAVVGLKEPDSGPPEEIKRAFVNPEKEGTSFTARRISAPPSEHRRPTDDDGSGARNVRSRGEDGSEDGGESGGEGTEGGGEEHGGEEEGGD